MHSGGDEERGEVTSEHNIFYLGGADMAITIKS